MLSFTRFFAVATLALAVAGAGIPATASAKCANPTTLTKLVDVDGNQVKIETIYCPSTNRGATTQHWVNSCGGLCDITCNNDAGDLPPIVEDCGMIKQAISIMTSQAGVSDAFGVPAGGTQTLTFGTCKFFFQNYSSVDRQYCYKDLSSTASRAGSACYPPILPLRSEGICKSADGTWAVASAHV